MGDKTKLAVQPPVSDKPATIVPADKIKKSVDVNFTLQTDVDDLIKLIEERKELSMADASKILGVPQQTVESWAIFLEEDGVLNIKYKLTTPYIVSKSLLETEEADTEPSQGKPSEKFKKNQIMIQDEAMPAKPKSAPSISDVPHVLKQISKDIDQAFGRAYEHIEAGRFEDAKNLYDSIRAESDSLPEELKELKKISNSLTKLNKDIGVNLEKHTSMTAKETEKEVTWKLQLMQKAFETGDIRQAEKHYLELQKTFADFPTGFGSRRTDIQTKINISYQKLLSRKKEFLVRYNAKKTRQISALLGEIKLDLQKKEIDAAIAKYEVAKRLYTQLPDGFAEENSQLSTDLFGLALDILTQKQASSSQEFLKLTTELKNLMKSCADSLNQGRIEEAEQLFNQAKETYKQLPTDFFNKRVDVETEFLELENQLLLKTKDTSLTKLKDILSRIGGSVKIAFNYLARNDVDLAEGVYYEILHLYKSLPDGFIEQKIDAGLTILNLYREIMKSSDEPLIKEFEENINARYNKIVQLIIGIREDMENNRFEVVESKTKEVADLFGHLPYKFVQEKAKIWKEIQSLSEEAVLYEKSKQLDTLADNPDQLRKTISEIKVLYSKLYSEYQSNPTYSNVLNYVREKYQYYQNLLRGSGIQTNEPVTAQTKKETAASLPLPPRPMPNITNLDLEIPKPQAETAAMENEHPQEQSSPESWTSPEKPEQLLPEPEKLPETQAGKPIVALSPKPQLASTYFHPQKSLAVPGGQGLSRPDLKHNVMGTLLSRADELTRQKRHQEARRVLLHIEDTYGQSRETSTRLRRLELTQDRHPAATKKQVPAEMAEAGEQQQELTPDKLRTDLIDSLLTKANHAMEIGRLEIAEMLFKDLLKIDGFNSQARQKLELIGKMRGSRPVKETLNNLPEPPAPDRATYPTSRDSNPEKTRLCLMKIGRLVNTIKSEAAKKRFNQLDEKYKDIEELINKVHPELMRQNPDLLIEVQNLSKIVELRNRSRNLSEAKHDPEQLKRQVDAIMRDISGIPADGPYSKIIKNIEYTCRYHLSSLEDSEKRKMRIQKNTPEQEPSPQLAGLASKLRLLESKIDHKLGSDAQAVSPKNKPLQARKTSMDKRHLKKHRLARKR